MAEAPSTRAGRGAAASRPAIAVLATDPGRGCGPLGVDGVGGLDITALSCTAPARRGRGQRPGRRSAGGDATLAGAIPGSTWLSLPSPR